MRLTPARRDELARTVCRFCTAAFPLPSMRKEHERVCDLAWGDVDSP